MIEHSGLPGRAVGLRETELDLERLAQTESLFALVQRPPRAARQPRRGRAARPPRHLPQPASTSCARCPTPRPATAIPRPARRHQRHQRQADPAAGRRRAVRRPLRHAALPRAGARPARRHAAPHASSGPRRPADGAGHLDAARLPHPASDRRDPLRGRAASTGRCASSCSPSWWPTSRCRRASDDPRAAAALESAARSEDTCGTRARGAAGPPTGGAACGWRPAMDHSIDGPERRPTSVESFADDRPA